MLVLRRRSCDAAEASEGKRKCQAFAGGGGRAALLTELLVLVNNTMRLTRCASGQLSCCR